MKPLIKWKIEKMKNKRYRIQDRDIEILKFLKDSRFLCIDQVKKKFWQDKTLKAAENRMENLNEMGLIKKIKIEITKYAAHYYLTKKGYEELKGRGLTFDVKTPFIPEPTDLVGANYHHHLRVTNLRIALEADRKIQVLRWISETDIRADKEGHNVFGPNVNIRAKLEYIKNKNYRIPDAIIRIKDAEDPIDMIFEYEHSKYTRDRFRKHMEKWEKSWNEYHKFIVAADADRVEVLRKWCLEDISKIHKLDLKLKSKVLDDLVDSYLFADYHSLLRKGMINSEIKNPLHSLEFIPITGR